MRYHIPVFLVTLLWFISISIRMSAQGWVAQIDLQLNHDLYAYEKISSATLNFSGLTASGSSNTSNLQFIIKGTGVLTGDIRLSVSGIAFQPYLADNPDSEGVSAYFSGNYTALCTRGFFEQSGETAMEQVYIWIQIFPRLEIADFENRCDEIILSAANCSATFAWEVSDNPVGPYLLIPGKSTSTVSVRTTDLRSLGFPNPYGRKYFRVTGRPGTTSLIQSIDIFYPPPGAALTSSSPSCYNSSDGSVRVNISSSNPALINDFVVTLVPEENSMATQQRAVNDQNTVIFSGLPAGRYRVRVENNSNISVYGSCGADFSADPLINPAAVQVTGFHTSDHNGYAISCSGGRDGTIRVIAGGGTGVYNKYEWTPLVSTTDYAGNLPEGIYRVRVRDGNNCWSQPAQVTLGAPGKLEATLVSTGGKNGYDVSCHDKSDGKISTTVSGGIPAYTFRWSNQETGPGLKDVAAGVYQVVITDANHCQTTEALTLIAPEPISFTLAEISGINCPGDSTGILEVQSPLNTIGQIGYEWSTGEVSRNIARKPAGQYAVTIKDEQGCSASASRTLNDPAAWTLELDAISDFNGSPIRCNGETSGSLLAEVKDDEGQAATADYYRWYQDNRLIADGPALSTLGELGAGTYRVEISYRTFCNLKQTYILTEPSPVTAAVDITSDYNGAAISCSGASDGSVRATASGGTGNDYEYRWESGETGTALSGLSAGTYSVQVTDINGCEGRAQNALSDPEPITVAIAAISDFHGMTLSCSGTSDGWIRADATGGTAPYTFAWNVDSQGPDLRNVPAGSYVATAIDANGCTAGSEHIINDPQPVGVNIEPSSYNGFGVSCNGVNDGYLSAIGSGGTGTYTFRWDGSADSGNARSGLVAGLYSVTLTDDNGCSASSGITLTEPEELVPKVLSVKNVSCNNGDDGEVQLSASGGSGNYQYMISDGTWLSDDVISGLRAGAYTLRVMDSNGCQRSISETVSEPDAISINFENVAPARCGDPRGGAVAQVSGGTAPYVYAWKNTAGVVLSQESAFLHASAGVYTVMVSDGNGCGTSKSIGIASTDGPQVSVENIVAASCFDTGDGSATLTITGSGPFTILWPDGRQSASVTGLAKGDYIVAVTDSQACMTAATVTITAPDSLDVALVEKIEPTCSGDCTGRLLVAATGGNGSYEYNMGGIPGPDFNGLCSGNYNVVVTDSKGCTASRTFAVRQPEAIGIKLVSATPPTCFNGCDGEIQVQTSGGILPYTFRWSDDSETDLIRGLCAGTYSLTVTDANKCVHTETYAIEDPEPESPNLGNSALICVGQTHKLDPGVEWHGCQWSGTTGLKSTDHSITISEPGIYWLEAVSAAGCLARDTFLLQTSRDLLEANFLLASEALTGDTVVMVDISWPVPETVVWQLPTQMTRLHEDADMVFGQFADPGHYDITLAASLGDCRDTVSRRIDILPSGEQIPEDGRLGHESFLKSFSIFPNPTNGDFDVVVAFQNETPVTLSVWHTLTGRNVAHTDARDSSKYMIHFDLAPLSAGTYTLRLEYNGGTEYRRFIVR